VYIDRRHTACGGRSGPAVRAVGADQKRSVGRTDGKWPGLK